MQTLSGLAGRLPFGHCDNVVTICFLRVVREACDRASPPLIRRVSIPLGHSKISVPEQLGNRKRIDSAIRESRCKRVPQIVETEALDLRVFTCSREPGLDVERRLTRLVTNEH